MNAKSASIALQATMFTAIGVLHFTNAPVFLAVMPPWLPYQLELVWLSGIFEIAGGLGLLLPKIRRITGICLIMLLIAVFPVNLHMALNSSDFPSIPSLVLWLRLPIQGMLIWWVNWSTSAGKAGKKD